MTFTEIRKEKMITQQDLAAKIGVKQSTIAMWETGKSVPCMKNILRISQVLGTSIDEICKSLKKNAKKDS